MNNNAPLYVFLLLSWAFAAVLTLTLLLG